MVENYGFIITRHVVSEQTNRYWNHCVKLLRTFYPLKKIVIIDDNSVQHFVKPDFDYENITLIQSEFRGRGELLPYYYFLKHKFFENAIIIHDSVFFHKRILFESFKDIKVLPFWFFYADKENLVNTLRISNALKNKWTIQNKLTLSDTVLGLSHLKWFGCFGCQSYINHNFLLDIERKYNISNMIHVVHSRSDRCCLERIFGTIFCTEYPNVVQRKSLFGNIMKYQKWGYSYNQYHSDLKKGTIPKEIVKIWTGR
jgi:hypothetical protein